ncbi:MAG TPA: tetratricopeptide repeat protein [Ktedonobacteraceae bacterium]|jgi:tetratricopeptide (TPR) repeat protein|nr:tetratricopeptide repeat protein [Ktedonobacteraceae bacterium]
MEKETNEVLRQQQGEFWLDYSQRLSTAIRYVEALAAAERAVTLLSAHAEAYYVRGTCQAMLAHYDAALADFDVSLQLNAQDAATWDGKAWVLGILGRKEEALAAIEQALALDPDYFEALKRKKRLLAME